MAITVYERDILTLAIALVEDTEPRLHVQALVREGTRTGLSKEGLGAVARVLSRGTARRLARGGAARVWDVAPSLRFGSASLDLLHWLHHTPISNPDSKPLRLRAAPTVAETLLFARALDLIEAVGVRALPEPFFAMPWLWVFRGEQLAAYREPTVEPADHLDPEGWLITTCHRELRGVWARWSRRARAEDVAGTIRHGTVQSSLAEALVIQSEGQPEQVAFLIDLMGLLADLPHAVWEIERGKATLSQWQQARQARVGLLRVMTELVGRWRDVWRSTGFLDDEYEQTQQWLRRYEPGLRALNSLRHPVERARHLPEVT